MKRMFLVILFFASLCVFNFSKESEAYDVYCQSSSEIVIVFGNGIKNTKKQAEDSLAELKKTLELEMHPEEFSRLEFKLAYNKTFGFFSDLYESLKQRVSSDNYATSFWRWIGNLEPLPDSVQEYALEKTAKYDISELMSLEDIEKHLTIYKTAFIEGKSVLLVAHSQGNLFANAAYQMLFDTEDSYDPRYFKILSIASPASFTAGEGSHVTLEEDLVVRAIRSTSLVTGAVPPRNATVTNLNGGVSGSDWKHHSFVNAYLVEGSMSYEDILYYIFSSIISLDIPDRIAQSGVITATLTWGSEPDVDLHTKEPNGTHVFYAMPYGSSGYLDVDDRSGYGPEHYYVSCDTLKTGVYTFGVNYYEGYNPERAVLQVQAGNSVRSYVIDLSRAYGSFGDLSPLGVAEIEVTYDENRGYDFKISSFQ